MIVHKKLIAPRMDEAPAICNEKIAKSTENPEWEIVPLRGGYTVQPVPTPPWIILLASNNVKDGGRSHSDKLFSRGNDISGAPINKGTNQLPKPPISVGITKKKIIKKA